MTKPMLPGCFGMMAMSMEQQLFFATFLWNKLHSLTARECSLLQASLEQGDTEIHLHDPMFQWSPGMFDQQQSEQQHHDTTTWFQKLIWNGIFGKKRARKKKKTPHCQAPPNFHGSDSASDLGPTRQAQNPHFEEGGGPLASACSYSFLRKMWCAHISKRSHVLRPYGLWEVERERVAPLVDLRVHEMEEGSCHQFNSNISTRIIRY